MQKYKQFGISFPTRLCNNVDVLRGDIPRSKYIQRIVEKYFREQELLPTSSKKIDSSDSTTPPIQEEGSDESTIT